MVFRRIWPFVVLTGTTATAILMLLLAMSASSSVRRVAAFTARRPDPIRLLVVFQQQQHHHHPIARRQQQQHRGFALFAASKDLTNSPDSSGQRAQPQHSSSGQQQQHPSRPATYYIPSRQSAAKRRFSSRKDDNDNSNNWHVPDRVHIPEKQLEFSFVRSSGAGGQNVNKVNTCVQVRFHVESALWMPTEVRQRFQQRFRNNINREGFYVTESQQERTQTANRRLVLAKLERHVLEAWPRPHVRKVREGISAKGKEIRRKEKEIVKNKKEGRKSVIDFD